ncbi:transcription factor [Ganoderma sinense ZZ0214-1]|uniref:Transcription factor n=1 Tax=Ganoderma sinense ZZ0214-1 TaxID=1077348 RepID=A0A2G8RVI2_9APHY|nr:transcription factor [Ganoderma sinense ZZ0214-1]
MASFKRARSPQQQDLSPSPSPIASPTPKLARASATPPPERSTSTSAFNHTGILCTLPPTCNPPHRPTALAGTRELEAHYAMYHAHVCEQRGCGCVFPDARLLELHQTECHDPLAAVRKERGEKIFECHLVTCARTFSTPKTRRLHLIQAHGYPKEYFFAVTNKGVGGLLKKWGEGASMLRKPWKSRENGAADAEDGDGDGVEDDAEAEDEDAMDAEGTHTDTHSAQGAAGTDGDDDDDDEDQILIEKMQIERPSGQAGSANVDSVGQGLGRKPRKGKGKEKHEPNVKASGDVDGLTNALDSLSLVPSSIQFGRGAKRGALQGGGGRGRGRRGSAIKTQEADVRAVAGTHGSVDEGAAMDVDYPPSRGGKGFARGGVRGIIPISRGGGGGTRRPARGRGRGGPPGAVLGAGAGRGMGPGRGVGKDVTKA